MNFDIFLAVLLGFIAGMPQILITASLAFWMADSGMNLVNVGFANVVTFPYIFQFIGGRVVDSFEIPVLSRLIGARRSWFFFNQSCIAGGLLVLSYCNPGSSSIFVILGAALFIAIFSSTQESMLFSHEIANNIKFEDSRMINSMRTMGFRGGVLFASAGPLYIASFLSWGSAYKIMALIQCVGVPLYLLMRSSNVSKRDFGSNSDSSAKIYKKSTLVMKKLSIIEPMKEILTHKSALLYLILMLIYRSGDNLIGSTHSIFYSSIGFSKLEIANISKSFGTFASVFGSFLAVYIMTKVGISKGIYFGLILHSVGIFTHLFLPMFEKNYLVMYVIVAFDHITGGMRTASVVEAKRKMCSAKYAATQYSLINSLTMLPRTLLGLLSGIFVEVVGWSGLFFAATVLALPGIFLAKYIINMEKRSAKYQIIS